MKLSEVEIIGSATVLLGCMLPSIVAPIYKSKIDNIVYLPPFELYDDEFITMRCEKITLDELYDWVYEDNAIIFKQYLEAKPNHTLWQNLDGSFLYEQTSIAQDKLLELYHISMINATNALKNNHLKVAEMNANIAISATESCEAFLVKAEIRRLQGDFAGQQLFLELAVKANRYNE